MIEFTSSLILSNNCIVIQSPSLIPAVRQDCALSSQGLMSCQSSEQSCTRLAKNGFIGINTFLGGSGGVECNKPHTQNQNTAWRLHYNYFKTTVLLVKIIVKVGKFVLQNTLESSNILHSFKETFLDLF